MVIRRVRAKQRNTTGGRPKKIKPGDSKDRERDRSSGSDSELRDIKPNLNGSFRSGRKPLLQPLKIDRDNRIPQVAAQHQAQQLFNQTQLQQQLQQQLIMNQQRVARQQAAQQAAQQGYSNNNRNNNSNSINTNTSTDTLSMANGMDFNLNGLPQFFAGIGVNGVNISDANPMPKLIADSKAGINDDNDYTMTDNNDGVKLENVRAALYNAIKSPV